MTVPRNFMTFELFRKVLNKRGGGNVALTLSPPNRFFPTTKQGVVAIFFYLNTVLMKKLTSQ